MIHSHRIVHFCGPETGGTQGGSCADPECRTTELASLVRRIYDSIAGGAIPLGKDFWVPWEQDARRALEAKP